MAEKLCQVCKSAPATDFISLAGNLCQKGWCQDCKERMVRNPVTQQTRDRWEYEDYARDRHSGFYG